MEGAAGAPPVAGRAPGSAGTATGPSQSVNATARATAASGPGARVIAGWAGCRHALSEHALVSDPHVVGLAPEPTHSLLMMEGERHRALRGLVTPHFAPSRVEALRPLLEERAGALVGAALERPDADLVTDVGEPLVLEAIMTVLGVPEDRRRKLAALAREMRGVFEPVLASSAPRPASRAALRTTLLFERERSAGRAAGLHARLEDAAEQGAIPSKLARATPVVMLHGGYENPLNQLGCIVALAVEDPERFLSAAASAPDVLFDEILRVCSPVRRLARWAADDATVGGVEVRRGEFVWVDLESAHRDPEQFPTRDLDLSRRRRNLGFGYGRHACLGSALARLEGQVLIEALLRVDARALREFAVEWHEDVVARGPARIVRRAG